MFEEVWSGKQFPSKRSQRENKESELRKIWYREWRRKYCGSQKD